MKRDHEIKDAVRDSFSRTAALYVTSETHAHGADLPLMSSWLSLTSGERVLDIATGGGHVVRTLAPSAAHVTATDLTPAMLVAARDHVEAAGIHNVTFVCCDAENLPFLDASFDVVTCRIAAHHFAHPDRFLREVSRVLTASGRFLFIDNVAPEDAEGDTFVNALEALRDPSHVRCARLSEWRVWLQRAGLVVVSSQTQRKTHPFTDWVRRTAVSDEQAKTVEKFLQEADSVLREQFAVQSDADGRIVSWTGTACIVLASKVNPMWVGLDHVQVAAPAQSEGQAIWFYGEVLGLAQIEKPAPLADRGGVWFAVGMQQLHVGVAETFLPATKAHPALRVESLDSLLARLQTLHVPYEEDHDMPGVRRIFLHDPFGNRIECVQMP